MNMLVNKTHEKLKSTIGRKLLLYILLASSCLTAFFTSISFYLDYQTASQSIRQTQRHIEANLVESLTNALHDIDQVQIEILVDGLMRIPEVVQASVMEQNDILYESKKNLSELDSPESSIFSGIIISISKNFVDKLSGNMNYVHEYTLDLGKGFPPGKFQYTLSLKPMYVNLYAKAIYFFFSQGLKTLLVSLIIISIVGWIVTRHLSKITNYIETTAPGSGKPLSIDRQDFHREDEIDFLVETINNMESTIYAHNIKKQKEIDEKEQQVKNSALLASLSDLAGNIAHEINNPLYIMLGFLKLLNEKIAKLDRKDSETERMIEKINHAAQRIQGVVNGMMLFSNRKKEEEYTYFDLKKVLSELEQLMQERLRSAQIELSFGFESNSPIYIHGSKRQLSLVILSLLNNSIEAVTPSRHPWIKVAVTETNDRVHIKVIDSGLGIEPSLQEKVFEPLYSTKSEGQGIGLGLSVSMGIVKQHKGSLYVDNKSENTCFDILLPKAS